MQEKRNRFTLRSRKVQEEVILMFEKKRVCCLYRVSTDKQVDYDMNHEADIPMQRKACHKFAEKMGWDIVHEEQEDGVSGHKVRAEKRDKVQTIKQLAINKEFDILLVFMFDRIGRIADETPFVVEWFVKNGIQVWSTQEGEQRFDNHIDKLLNYIRFWQADGESEKTSIRTKTSMGQLVEEGHFKGGIAAFGYSLVKTGRYNKRKHEVYDLIIYESEAMIVRLIYNKYINDGFGSWRIANYLNDNGYRTRNGRKWVQASVRTILSNLTYTGVLRCGNSRSDVIPDLQIITQEQFSTVQDIYKSRRLCDSPHVPMNTRGQSLLAGNVYCGHCGSRLNLTTNGRYRKRKDGSIDKAPRVRYSCYGKTRKRTECDGQTGYTMKKLDSIVEKLIKQVFSKMKIISKNEVVSESYEKECQIKKNRLMSLQTEIFEEQRRLDLLRNEVIKCLEGKSNFTSEVLSSLIVNKEKSIFERRAIIDELTTDLQHEEESKKQTGERFDRIISWAELYDNASIEAKKMIVNSMITRIDVFRGYKLKVEFAFDIRQFFEGLDFEYNPQISK